MPGPEISAAHWLKNYDWEMNKKQGMGDRVIYIHPRKPGHEIHLYDNGRIDHLLKNQKISSIDSKNVGAYLKKIMGY